MLRSSFYMSAVALVVLLLASCAQIAADNRVKEYEALLNPMVGTATREDIARQFGAPYDRQSVGSIEIWTYRQSFGARGHAYVSPYNQYGTYGTAHSREVYDNLSFTFNSLGILESWRVYVQR